MFFNKKLTSSSVFGLYLSENKLVASFANDLNLDNPSAFAIQTVDRSKEVSFEKALRNLRQDHDLQGALCDIVLPASQYQILLIDRPSVSPQEYRAAALWQSKDMLKYPIEDCAVDVFKPSDQILIHRDKLYVVASRKSYLSSLVDQLGILDITAKSILVEEFAVRNIITKSVGTKHTAFLACDEGDYLLTIFCEGDVLFTRRLKTNIIQEIYRSFDFYEVTLKQNRLENIYVQGVSENILSEIKEYFSDHAYNITPIKLSHVLLKYQSGSMSFNYSQVLAIGAMFQQAMDGVVYATN